MNADPHPSDIKPPRVGRVVVRDGRRWRITGVWLRLTPFERADQDTRIEGYTLGLCAMRPWRPCRGRVSQ